MNIFEKRIVGIDFHDYSAQVVELSLLKGKISLEAYNRITIPAEIIRDGEIAKPDELKILIKNLLQNANPKPIDSKNVAIIFPSSKVFTHIFKLPANLNENEIKNTLSYEAETVIPFAIQDMYWDYRILEQEKTFKQVLFGAIPRTTADKYTNLLESLGLTPLLFGIDVESLEYGLIRQADPKKASLVIDVGALSTNYLILENNIIKHFFSNTEGGQELIADLNKEFQTPVNTLIQQKEKNNFDKKYIPKIEYFIEHNYKVAQKIIDYKKDEIKNIDEIFLTGEFLNLPKFFEIAQKLFSKKQISIGDPRKYLAIEVGKFKEPATDNQAYYSTYFINAVGVALRALLAKDKGINLLPDSFKQTISKRKKSLAIAFTSISMAIISLFIATFMFFKHQDLVYQRMNLEIKKSSVDQLIYGTRYQEIRSAIESFNKEVSELGTVQQSLFSVPALMKEIYKLIPGGITISNLKFMDSDLSVEITGIASDRETLLELNQNFKQAPFVSEVVTPISNFDQKYKISFVIKLKLLFKELTPYGAIANT